MQSLLGRRKYTDPYKDVRLVPTADERREWTDEEIRALITNNGAAAKPEDHKGWVENPLAPCDWVGVSGLSGGSCMLCYRCFQAVWHDLKCFVHYMLGCTSYMPSNRCSSSS